VYTSRARAVSRSPGACLPVVSFEQRDAFVGDYHLVLATPIVVSSFRTAPRSLLLFGRALTSKLT
jgi:hypothetical protein